jgi:head-tail adaptor
MNAGRLAELVLLEKKTITLDERGGKVESWAPDPATPGGMVSAETTRVSETAARFVLRYRTDIRPGAHRIVFWNARWNVTDVVPDPRRDVITIDSDFSEKIEVTHLQSDTKEWIDGLPVVHP